MAYYNCVDVSEWNRQIDWKQAKEDSVEFAFIRCGLGKYYLNYSDPDKQADMQAKWEETNGEDKYFQINMQGAIEAGIKIGAYFYSYARNAQEAEDEAIQCVNEIAKYKDAFSLPLFLDVEEKYQEPILYEVITAFINKVREYGYYCGVYTSGGWYSSYFRDIDCDYIWLAYWGADDGVPHNKPDYCDIWQYSSVGSVNGIGSYCVDVDILYNTEMQILIDKEEKPMGNCYGKKAVDYAIAQIGKPCGKYSEYAAEMDAVQFYNYPKNGQADSCSLFVDNCVWHACTEPTVEEDPEGSKYTALYMVCEPEQDNCGAGCVQSVDYFKSKGQWVDSTQDMARGDKIFYRNQKYVKSSNPYGVYHTGIIVDWGDFDEGSGFKVVEGNTDGGVVAEKFVSYGDPKILGAGRPRYDAWEEDVTPEPEPTPEPTPEPPKPSPEPAEKAVVELDILQRYSTGGQVNTLKALLNEFGYATETYNGEPLPLDGDFDYDTEQAVNNFKEAHGLPEDGIVDAETWNFLLK